MGHSGGEKDLRGQCRPICGHPQVPGPLQRGLGLLPMVEDRGVAQETGSGRAAPMYEEGARRSYLLCKGCKGGGASWTEQPAGLGPGKVNWGRRRREWRDGAAGV